MKISIVTICFNSTASIEDTIKSVLSQTHPDIEYIIIDGKSTDNTLEIVSRYKDKIAIIVSEKDNGLYDAINKGIKKATGDVVGLIHSDDFFADEKVIEKVNRKFEMENTDALYGDLQYVDKENTNKVIRNWISGVYSEGMFKMGWMPPHPSFYVKRKLYDELGFYRTDFRFAADYELMLRFIHKNKIKLGYLPEVMVKMRVGGKSNVSISNRLKANKEDRMAWEVNGLSKPWYTTIVKPLRKISQYF